MVLEQQFDEDHNVTLGALSGAAAIFGASKIDAGREQGFRLVKSNVTVSFTGKTASEGPISFGVCCNVPTAAELASVLVNDPQGSSSNKKRADNWFIKPLGVISLLATATDAQNNIEMTFEISYGKNGWSIPEGSALNYYAFNMGSALTTGTVIIISAEHFGVWLRD